MSLLSSKSILEQSIQQAFANINRAGSQDGSNPEANIQALAEALSSAIHNYVTSANVDITGVTTIVNPGIPVAPPPSVPATTAPGTTVHTGFGRLL